MAGWAALILVVLPLAHAAGPVGLALDTTCTNAECYKQRNMTLLKQALLANYDMTVQPPRFGTERGALVSVQFRTTSFRVCSKSKVSVRHDASVKNSSCLLTDASTAPY